MKFFYVFLNFIYKVLLLSNRKVQFYSIDRCGSNVYVSEYCYFNVKNFIVGDNVYFGRGCIIQSVHGSVVLGNNIMFGPCVHIHGGNHIFSDTSLPMYFQGKGDDHCDPTLIIEDDVWVGANVTILAGVKISTGAVIAAGSVVVSDVEPYTIVGGVPARLIKTRK